MPNLPNPKNAKRQTNPHTIQFTLLTFNRQTVQNRNNKTTRRRKILMDNNGHVHSEYTLTKIENIALLMANKSFY